MPTIDDLRKVRIDKLAALKKKGLDPYPADVERKQTIKVALAMKGKEVAVVGRVMGVRGHGKIVFLDLVDATGKMQVVIKNDLLEKESSKLIDYLDIGDFLGTQGSVDVTQAGETSVFAKTIRIISKAVRPLPDQWHGLKDVEERYRQRYVDLVVNPGVRDIFVTRTKVIQFLRKFLDRDGFLEVETPVLQPIYGGASAKPFVTHHNALDSDLYLRISDELYLKRLIVAGFEQVYEISKDFRNEGIDRQHNPEFTMLEFYWAYANYDKLMRYTETMLSELVKEVKGSIKLTYQGVDLDFTPPWPRKTYRDVVLEFTGIDINNCDTEDKLLAAIKEKHIQLDLTGVVGYGALLDTLYKSTARPHLTGPMYLTDRPTAFVALAKRLPDDPKKTASFQLLIAGKEVLNAYNELNDPADQEARWLESEGLGEKGQDEHEVVDRDYIRALEYGMPPTAGWGMGIDRLVSIFTDQASLKEVILFPTLRPEFVNQKPVRMITKPEFFTIAPEVKEQLPTVSIGVALIRGVRVEKINPELEKDKENILSAYSELLTEGINQYPEILSYRKLYKQMGVDWHSRRPSPEALLRRVALKKGLYTVNTCVDAYNLIVLKHRVSVGAFDLDNVQFPTVLRYAGEGDEILLLGDESPTKYSSKELAYYDRAGGYNIDFNYRDSKRTMVTEKTTNIWINVDGVFDITSEMVERTLHESVEMILKYCGGTVEFEGVVQ